MSKRSAEEASAAEEVAGEAGATETSTDQEGAVRAKAVKIEIALPTCERHGPLTYGPADLWCLKGCVEPWLAWCKEVGRSGQYAWLCRTIKQLALVVPTMDELEASAAWKAREKARACLDAISCSGEVLRVARRFQFKPVKTLDFPESSIAYIKRSEQWEKTETWMAAHNEFCAAANAYKAELKEMGKARHDMIELFRCMTQRYVDVFISDKALYCAVIQLAAWCLEFMFCAIPVEKTDPLHDMVQAVKQMKGMSYKAGRLMLKLFGTYTDCCEVDKFFNNPFYV